MKSTASFAIAAALALTMAPRVIAHDMGAMGQMGAHMSMGPHMVMTEQRSPTDADLQRAREVMRILRESIEPYRDNRRAVADGYVPFLPTIPQEVYHFTNYRLAVREYTEPFDAAQPGSLLYTRNAAGEYRLVGAMYSAAPQLTPADLDERVPLSVARWHAHTNICLPKDITLRDLIRGNIGAGGPPMPGMVDAGGSPIAVSLNQRLGVFADGRFGFTGKIADQPDCEAAGGHFIKQAWGWMVHVYPFSGDDLKIAFGTDVPKQ